MYQNKRSIDEYTNSIDKNVPMLIMAIMNSIAYKYYLNKTIKVSTTMIYG